MSETATKSLKKEVSSSLAAAMPHTLAPNPNGDESGAFIGQVVTQNGWTPRAPYGAHPTLGSARPVLSTYPMDTHFDSSTHPDGCFYLPKS